MRGICLFLMVAFIMPFAEGQVYSTDRGHAEVHGDAPATSYTGVSNELKGAIDFNTKAIDFSIRLESIDTDNSKRNGHMFEALNTQAYPYAKFKGKLTSDYDPENMAAQQVTANGIFTIHGVSKPVQITGVLDMASEGLQLNASFPIYLTHYGMERPSVFFMTVEDKHIIEVNTLLYEKSGTAKY